MNPSPEQCANLVLETAPMVMRTIRNEFRKNRTGDISIPQFRVLAFLGRRGNASLSEVADHMGITMPSASKLVERLVIIKHAHRSTESSDRRQVKIRLSETGAEMLDNARKAARQKLTQLFSGITKKEMAQIMQAMEIFKTVFACDSKKCQKRNAK